MLCIFIYYLHTEVTSGCEIYMVYMPINVFMRACLMTIVFYNLFQVEIEDSLYMFFILSLILMFYLLKNKQSFLR